MTRSQSAKTPARISRARDPPARQGHACAYSAKASHKGWDRTSNSNFIKQPSFPNYKKRKERRANYLALSAMAERMRLERTMPCGTPHFQCGSLPIRIPLRIPVGFTSITDSREKINPFLQIFFRARPPNPFQSDFLKNYLLPPLTFGIICMNGLPAFRRRPPNAWKRPPRGVFVYSPPVWVLSHASFAKIP